MKLRHACAALLIFGITGCELGTEPDDDVPPGSRLPSSDFTAWLAQPGNQPVPDFEVRGETGQITVRGPFGTPVPCYALEAYADTREGTIDVAVVAESVEGVCITVVATFGYEAVIRDLAAGTYNVRLSHHVGDRQSDVLEAEVTVD